MQRSPKKFVVLIVIFMCAGTCRQAFAGAGDPVGLSQPYTWNNAPIVGGGFVSGIIAHPAEPGLMYARTDIGGAYRRSASESKWVAITDWIDQAHWNYEGIESIAIDPKDPKYVFISAGCYTSQWSGNGAILRSSDRGNTFAITPMPFKMGGNEDGRGMGERLVVDPNHGSRLVLGSRRNGLWMSDDRGGTWSRVQAFPDTQDTAGIGIEAVVFDATSASKGTLTRTLFAAVASGKTSLYESHDTGTTWKPVANQPPKLFPHHMIIDDQGTLYITYGNRPGPNGVTDGAVYKLAIATHEWTNITPVAPDASDKFGYSGLTLDRQHTGVLMVSTLDRWTKTDDLFRSNDGGLHWTSIREKSIRDWSAAPWLQLGKNSVGIGHWISSIQIDPFDSNHLLYDTGWGMWESHDLTASDRSLPTHWKVAAEGIEEGVMNDLVSPPAGAHLLTVMWDIDGYRHDDLNKSPASGSFNPHCGGNTSIDFAQQRPDIVSRVYGGQPVGGETDTHSRGAFSTDNGITWTAFPSSPAGAKGDGTIAISADGNTFVWTPNGQSTFFSKDNGSTWTASHGIPANLRVISDRATPEFFYAYDDHGNLFASVDGGATFQLRSHDLAAGKAYLKAVPGFAGNLWLATTRGLLFSQDGGKTFDASPGPSPASRIGFGMPAPGAQYPAIYVVGDIAGQYGFYRSDDRGMHWFRINDDQHQFAEITAITGDPRIYGRVYLASRSRGTLYGDIAPNHP